MCLGFLFIWLFDLQPIWVVVLAVFGGACGFVFHGLTLSQRAKCPSCGGSWEMEALNQRCVPNTRFYLKECPFCKMKIPASKREEPTALPWVESKGRPRSYDLPKPKD